MNNTKGNAVLFSEMTPPTGREDEFNDWYDGHHSPSHVQGVPGFISAMRYQAPTGPHFLAIYELTGPEALERTLMSMPICGITLKYLKSLNHMRKELGMRVNE